MVHTGSKPTPPEAESGAPESWCCSLRDRGHARGGGARAAVAPERLGHGEARPLLLDAHREARHAHHLGPLAGLLVREQHGVDRAVDGVADRVPAGLGARARRRERDPAPLAEPGQRDGRQHDETGHADRRAHARLLPRVTPPGRHGSRGTAGLRPEPHPSPSRLGPGRACPRSFRTAGRSMPIGLVADVARVLRGAGIADRWKPAGVSAKDLAEHLYATAIRCVPPFASCAGARPAEVVACQSTPSSWQPELRIPRDAAAVPPIRSPGSGSDSILRPLEP